ncbi:MAG: TRAP transporter large permease [Rhizobiales bacterium]|nr:TRAP transporter large permease [Hyphomicrobiales bacterium]
MTIALIAFAILIILVFLRIPIAFAMGAIGIFGYAYLKGFKAAFSMASGMIIDTGQDYGLTVIPLFILMGLFVNVSGLSKELYAASYAFLGKRKGGLAMATIVACGGFSAICGSSLATAATMSKVAMPSMRKYGYADSLATASIAAGGTLGILIPPSVILVMYGLLTEVSIGKLFLAGVLPGILGIILYLVAVKWTVWRDPSSGPAGETFNWAQKIEALSGISGVLALFLLVIGGIYAGVFTPTEAAGIGSGGALLIGFLKRKMTWAKIMSALIETITTTAMLFSLVIGATIFSNFVNLAGLPEGLLAFVTGFDLSPILILLLIMGVYIVLGCVFESLSMLLLTVPVFYQLIQGLDFGMTPEMNLIWFGILVVVVTEISLITPPVGLNVFVLRGVLKDVSTKTIFKGVTPFWAMDIVRLGLLILIPSIALIIPFS